MSKYKVFDGVRMAVDKYESKGVPKGKVGTVLDIQDNGIAIGYTVEFYNPSNGETILLNTFPEEELELVEWEPQKDSKEQ